MMITPVKKAIIAHNFLNHLYSNKNNTTPLANLELKRTVSGSFFNTANVEDYILSIYISDNEVSYAVTHLADNVVLHLKSHHITSPNTLSVQNALASSLESENWDISHFQKIIVSINTPNYTLVPSAFCDRRDREAYFAFNQPLPDHHQLNADELILINLTILYSVDEHLIETLNQILGEDNYILHHAQMYMIKALAGESAAAQQRRMVVQVQYSHISISILQNGKLAFHNTFSYQLPEELLYHILNVAQQTQFDIQSYPVVLLGHINIQQAAYRLCAQYLPHLQLGKRPNSLYYCQELNYLPQHELYHLFVVA